MEIAKFSWINTLIVLNRCRKDQITFVMLVTYRLGHKGTLCFVCHCNILKMVVYSKKWVCNLYDFKTIEAFVQSALTSRSYPCNFKKIVKIWFWFSFEKSLSYKIFEHLTEFLILVAWFVERYAFYVAFSRNQVIALIINLRRTKNYFFLPMRIPSCSVFACEIRTDLDTCSNVNKVLSTNNKQTYLSY